MKIKDVEKLTNMPRTNIRFYEMEGFIQPTRHNNGYRDYSEEDVSTLLKIKLLRHLGLSLDEIKLIHNKSINLNVLLKNHILTLSNSLDDTKSSLEICNQLMNENTSYDELNEYSHILINQTNKNKYYFNNPIIWKRFLAKIFDLGFYYFIFIFGFALDTTITYFTSIDRYYRPLIDILGMLLIMFLLEPIILTIFKTTLGKFIFGLKLEFKNSSYFDMLKRTTLVFVHGLGCFFPIISLLCLYRNYIICENNHPLSWEFNNKTVSFNNSKSQLLYIPLLSLLLVYGMIVSNNKASFPLLRNGFVSEHLGTLEFGGNFNNYLVYQPSILEKDVTFWDEDNVGYIVDTYNNPINDRRFPAINFVSNDNHEITEISFNVEWNETSPHHYIEMMSYIIRSSIKANESIFIPFSKAEQIIDYIEKHPFESFEFVEDDYTITCNVEYGGGYQLNCLNLEHCTLAIVTYADNYVEPDPYYIFDFSIQFNY